MQAPSYGTTDGTRPDKNAKLGHFVRKSLKPGLGSFRASILQLSPCIPAPRHLNQTIRSFPCLTTNSCVMDAFKSCRMVALMQRTDVAFINIMQCWRFPQPLSLKAHRPAACFRRFPALNTTTYCKNTR